MSTSSLSLKNVRTVVGSLLLLACRPLPPPEHTEAAPRKSAEKAGFTRLQLRWYPDGHLELAKVVVETVPGFADACWSMVRDQPATVRPSQTALEQAESRGYAELMYRCDFVLDDAPDAGTK